MFFITVETKTLKFMILNAFCVRQPEMTFASILKLMNFYLFELDIEGAAIRCGVNRRVITKMRSFIFLKLGNNFLKF
jgi:hypothetical protein